MLLAGLRRDADKSCRRGGCIASHGIASLCGWKDSLVRLEMMYEGSFSLIIAFFSLFSLLLVFVLLLLVASFLRFVS